MKAPNRYPPLMVVLHWLTVILILSAGALSENRGRSAIAPHMVLGALLLVIMVVRLITRLKVTRPVPADTGSKFLNLLGDFVHFGLYAAAFYILALGGIIAWQRNLAGYLFNNENITRANRVIGELHGLGWSIVLLLLFLHLAGVVYHHFILKDNLIKRMWFEKS